MRLTLSIAGLLLAAGLLAGCGGPSAPFIPGPKNGGNMVALPENQGYVEFRLDGDPVRSGKGELRAIAFFFYARDGQSPMSPAPTDVVLKDGNGKEAPLEPRATDGAFVSKPGGYADGFQGRLTAKIGGVPVEVRVGIR